MVSLMPFRYGAALVALLFTLSAVAQQPAQDFRMWTVTNGLTFGAKLVGIEGDSAVFQLADGQTAKLALKYHSDADRALAGPGAKPAVTPFHTPRPVPLPQPAPVPQPGPAPQPAPVTAKPPAVPATVPAGKPRTWPAIIEVLASSLDIATVVEDPANRKCVYKSQSFEFTSQDKLAISVMREIARTFEATKSVVTALPWGIDPKPPVESGVFQAKLFTTREDYFADGGPANSGGVYSPKDHIFRVPFTSLGLEMRRKTWFKRADYRGDTIVHEVTHQMMHDILRYLPKWAIEGTAEYVENLPYSAGRFLANSHERGLKEEIKNRSQRNILTSQFRPFADIMTMKRAEWNALAMDSRSQSLLYYQSYLLVYYFNHLDGDGKGTRFLNYLGAINAARGSRGSEDTGIEKLNILMDGRDPAKLEADIKNGFKKLGIKL